MAFIHWDTPDATGGEWGGTTSAVVVAGPIDFDAPVNCTGDGWFPAQPPPSVADVHVDDEAEKEQDDHHDALALRRQQRDVVGELAMAHASRGRLFMGRNARRPFLAGMEWLTVRRRSGAKG